MTTATPDTAIVAVTGPFGIPWDEDIFRLRAALQFGRTLAFNVRGESAKLEQAIKANLRGLVGYGG